MPWDTAAEFYAQPKRFMRHNLVLAPKMESITPDQVNNDRIRFEIYKVTADIVVNKPGFGVWRVRAIDPNSTSGRSAYWCDYKPNDVAHGTIGMDSSFFFTAEMSGCSLAIGNETFDRTRSVGHFNASNAGMIAHDQTMADEKRKIPFFDMRKKYYPAEMKLQIDEIEKKAEEAGRKAQSKQQKANITNDMGQNVSVIRSKDYRESVGEVSTTFGRRSGSEWRFYTLVFEKEASFSGYKYQWKGLYRQLSGVTIALNDEDGTFGDMSD